MILPCKYIYSDNVPIDYEPSFSNKKYRLQHVNLYFVLQHGSKLNVIYIVPHSIRYTLTRFCYDFTMYQTL